MSFGRSDAPKRTRRPSCTLCSNHGIRSDLKGHKYHCEYSDCECKLCDRGRERREVMRKQVKLRRHQMRQIYAEKSGARTASELKVDSSSQRMMPPIRFEPQTQAPLCNVSPGYPFPRFPPRGIPYTQSNAVDSMAYFLNMSPPGLLTQRSHSPLQRLSPALGRLSVSDNSAFVRFSPQSNTIHGAISNGWPACEVSDSKEAAYALASLHHKKNQMRLK